MSTQNAALAIISSEPNKYEVSIPQGFQEQINDWLEKSKVVTEVQDPHQQQKAVTYAGILKGLAGSIEDSRVEIKRPFLEACTQIDASAKVFKAPILKRAEELERLASDYQTKEDQRRELERVAEVARQRKAQEEADAARRRLEEAQSEQDRLAASFDAMEAQEELKEVRTSAIVTSEPKVAGAAVGERVTFEVTDIAALYAARPDLVSLSPKTREINELIKLDQTPIPGIKISRFTRVTSRKMPSVL